MLHLIVFLLLVINTEAYSGYVTSGTAHSNAEAKAEQDRRVLRALDKLQSQNDALLEKFAEVEADAKQLRETVERLESDNRVVLERLESLDHENREQTSLITSLADKLVQVENRIQRIEGGIIDINKTETFQISEGHPRRQPIQRNTRALLADEALVAFFATISAHEVGHLGVNLVITFDNVVTNLGNAYNPMHGRFVAPFHGVYMISVTIGFWYTDSGDMYVHYVLNGNVEGGPGGFILGDHNSSFSGQLVSHTG